MIRNRPSDLQRFGGYSAKMPFPIKIDWRGVPEPIKLSLLTLDGIQPITVSVAEAADGLFSAIPSEELIEFYRTKNPNFQMIFVVLSGIYLNEGESCLVPYKISVLPSNKRGNVSNTKIEYVSGIARSGLLEQEYAYLHYDPFVGEWGLWGEASFVVGDNPKPGWPDEIGLTQNGYFLDTQCDPEEICYVDYGIPSSIRDRYLRHQQKLLFKPFDNLRSRSVWGVENALELFLFEELVYRGYRPAPQTIVLADGGTFPSLYNLWWQAGIQGNDQLISEVDFWFENERLAVFCDGATHGRGEKKLRDTVIDQRLAEVGIKSLRVPSKTILRELKVAGDLVAQTLEHLR